MLQTVQWWSGAGVSSIGAHVYRRARARGQLLPTDSSWGHHTHTNINKLSPHTTPTRRPAGVHNGDGPQLLKLEGCDLKPTSKDVVWPVEWWTLTINAQKVRLS
jgi:hypothetical protein